MIPVPPAMVCQIPVSVRIEEARLLEVIRMVEGDHTNPYGLSPAVRAQHSLRAPKGTDYEIALAHLKWLQGELGRNGKPVTAYNLALCWNLGLTGGMKIINGRHWSEAGMDYADRVKNLYELPDKQV